MSTTPPRLIGLTSPAMGSGKTTLASHLVAQHRFIRIPFAGPIKAMTQALLTATGIVLPVAQRMVDGDLKESNIRELGVSARTLMQTIGTEWGRKTIRDDLWVHIAIQKALDQIKHGRSVVIDDVRFPNELDAIEAAGGEVFRIVRPGAQVTTKHASEGALDGIHLPEIWNTGTVEELQQRTDSALFR